MGHPSDEELLVPIASGPGAAPPRGPHRSPQRQRSDPDRGHRHGAAGVLSVPLGIALDVGVYALAGGDGDPTIAPWTWLALVPIGTVLMVGSATSLPARFVNRAPTADILRYE